jgi:hypothetical protein
MSDDYQQRIRHLRAEIDERERFASGLQTEIAELERELRAFQARYDRVITPLKTRLDALKAAIAELEAERLRDQRGSVSPTRSSWTPPPDYVPVEEQYRRVWEIPRQAAADAAAEIDTAPTGDARALHREEQIKRLFRALARRFHPDLAADDADRARRTAIMIHINEVYAQRDLGALMALAEQPDAIQPDQPLSLLTLRGLQQQSVELEARIVALQRRRDDLFYGEMMKLKLDDKLAGMRGRDLLREMAARLNEDYYERMAYLDRLRGTR